MGRRAVRSLGSVVAAVLLLLTVAAGCGADDGARSHAPKAVTSASGDGTDARSGLPWVAVADLPPQARDTLALIDAGGPFPYPGKDGSTFGNLERLLPVEQRGYYAEYTVATPGSRDRGARRIITGDGGELYWTADHYQHFERIRR